MPFEKLWLLYRSVLQHSHKLNRYNIKKIYTILY